MSGATYHELIARNRRNSAMLVVVFVVFVGVLVGTLSGALLEADLSHDPDRMILHISSEYRQQHKSCIAGVEEDSERLSRRWNDAPCYGVVRQL